MRGDPIRINCAFEGSLDEQILKRLIRDCGASHGDLHKHRRSKLREKIDAFNNSARNRPWVVLIDQDLDPCAPEIVNEWLPDPAPYMNLRVAVREIEVWLLADRERLARFLRVREARITRTPETIDFPKEYLINVARGSASEKIRKGIVPRPSGKRIEGPAYLSLLTDFVNDEDRGWRPDVASVHSDSLARCIRSIDRIVQRS